jgi:hypothetical protein
MSETYRKTVLRIAGFIASIMLIAASILLMRMMELLAGSILLVVSVILFLLAVRAIDQHPLTDDEVTFLKPHVFPALFLIDCQHYQSCAHTNIEPLGNYGMVIKHAVPGCGHLVDGSLEASTLAQYLGMD